MATYNITNLIPNVTSGNKTIIIEADSNHNLPSSVTVTNGTLVSYDSSTGVAVISGDDAVISATCPLNITPYLTFSSPFKFTLRVMDQQKYWDGTIEYSTDTTTWNTWDGITTLSSSSSGDTKYLYLRGIGNTHITGISTNSGTWRFEFNGTRTLYCDGNIETLLDYATVARGQHPPMSSYCYSYLFVGGGDSLKTAPTLPAETLTSYCYYYMFRGCQYLLAAPALPATKLESNCYRSMFQECRSLTTAPALPATTLANYCYYNMFQGCTKLTTAPALPATTLANYCYGYMFQGCTALTTASALPATTLANYCYYYMFSDCTALTKPAIMAGGTTQAVSAKYCCYRMYYKCTNLNMYTSSSGGRVPCYKAITYSSSSSSSNYRASSGMFYNCKIDGATNTTLSLTAGTQYYC